MARERSRRSVMREYGAYFTLGMLRKLVPGMRKCVVAGRPSGALRSLQTRGGTYRAEQCGVRSNIAPTKCRVGNSRYGRNRRGRENTRPRARRSDRHAIQQFLPCPSTDERVNHRLMSYPARSRNRSSARRSLFVGRPAPRGLSATDGSFNCRCGGLKSL